MTVVVYGRVNDPVAYDEDLTLSDEELKQKARSNLEIDNFNDDYYNFDVLATEDAEVRYVMLCTLIRGVGATAAQAETHLKNRFNNTTQPDEYEPAIEIGKLDYFDHIINVYTIEEELSGHLAHTI